MRYCTRCGTTAGPTQAFCIRCGAPLASPAAAATAAPGSMPAAPGDGPAAAAIQVPEARPGGRHQRSDPEPASPPDSDRPPGPGPGRRSTITVALAVLVLVLGGGAVAGWKLLGHRTAPRSGARSPAGTAEAAGATATSAPPNPPSPAAGTPGAIVIGPAVSQLAATPQVAAFLDAYFAAINARDYSSYTALFTPALRSTPAQFQAGYRSTSDSGATLTGITPAAAGVAAAVTFTSHQQAAASQTRTSCTTWDITLYLVPHGSSYWIVHAPAGYHAQYEPC
jgi:hypothetical protein